MQALFGVDLNLGPAAILLLTSPIALSELLKPAVAQILIYKMGLTVLLLQNSCEDLVRARC